MDYGWQTVLGQTPSKANSYKVITINGHESLGKTKALVSYERDFYMQCGRYRNLGIASFFEYHCRVFYKTMSSDLDNHCKIVLDCLQKVGAIANDNKCVKIVAEKFIDRVNPRIEFKIVTVDWI